MSIRSCLFVSFLSTCGVVCLSVSGESSVTTDGVLYLRSPQSDLHVALLPINDSVELENHREIELADQVNVTITRLDDLVRYVLETPRGNQSVLIDVRDKRTRMGFDPARQAIRTLENSFRVVLSDYTEFETFLNSIDSKGRAFPALNRAFVTVPLNSDHESLYERLAAHPLVERVDFVFTRPSAGKSKIVPSFDRPTGASQKSLSKWQNKNGSGSNSAPETRYDLSAEVTITEISPKDVSGFITIRNEGTEPHRYADGGAYEIHLGKLEQQFTDLESYEVVDREGARLYELSPNAVFFQYFFRLRPHEWDAEQLYVLAVEITTNDSPTTFGHKIFATNHDGEPIVSCPAPDRVQDREITGDPFYEHQWALENTGQTAFGTQGGVSGEDVRMQMVRELDLGGRNVHVAIVDTGLDICHPDLQSNIAQSQSINFRHQDWSHSYWPHVRSSDPYNPVLVGDHGTGMAGVIGAVADNGIATRGVAPYVWLRGFNYLTNVTTSNYLTALGSGETRHTNDVDVFNLSFGDNDTFVIRSLADIEEDNAPFIHGTSVLRNGLGASYVKASGNEFNSCTEPRNEEIGCVSSQTDRVNSSPYIITVGALNAAGRRAAYSNAGSNIWMTAPGGSRDTNASGYPGLMSVDQFGLDRGYMWTRPMDHWSRDPELNPRGSVLAPGGTSLANAMVTGAIAILLEVNPNLSWRDIKHILAMSARQVDVDTEQVSYSDVSLAEDVVTQHAWQTNGAGHSFHNYYGFGALDIDSAVELATAYEPNSLGERVVSDWVLDDSQTDIEIPDAYSPGAVASISIDSEHIPQDTTVEATEVVVHMSHTWAADVQFELTSPSGMVSILSPPFNRELREDIRSELLYFGSNAFYGEQATGTWQLRFRDLFGGDVGSVYAAYIRIHGASSPIATVP